MALSARKVPKVAGTSWARLVPALPGLVPQVGAAAPWATTIRTSGATTIEWRIRDGRNTARADWVALTDARLAQPGGMPFTVPFVSTGDVFDVRVVSTPDVRAQSGRVRVMRLAPTEPALPAGWSIVAFDDFSQPRVDAGIWRLVRSAGGFDPAMVRTGNSLTLQAVRNTSGVLRSGGVRLSGSDIGGPALDDLQVSIRVRVGRGPGGALVSLVPWQAGASLPRLDLVQPQEREQDVLLVSDRWVGNPGGVSARYPLDLTRWQTVTARRTAGRWNLWINGAEQVVPQEWARDLYRTPLTLSLAVDGGSVAPGGLVSAQFRFVRVSAPQ